MIDSEIIDNMNSIIDETGFQHDDNWNVLYEFAIARKEFKNRIPGILDSIIAHIGAVLYVKATHNEKYFQYIEHWVKEIKAFIRNIRKLKIQTDKKNAIKEIIYDDYNYTESDVIAEIILSKLENEDIIVNTYRKNFKKELFIVITDIIDIIESHEFMDAMVHKNGDKLEDFIKNFIVEKEYDE